LSDIRETLMRIHSLIALPVALFLAGCAGEPKPAAPPAAVAEGEGEGDDVAAERAKLSPADRALVDAQEWCVISDDERLGSMGPPIKLDIQGKTVFICCGGCRKKALADPAKTLAKLDELKAKAKAAAAKTATP
jgi:hypothetical protein